MDPHSVVLDMFLDDDMSSCSYSSFTSRSPYYHPPSPQPVFSHLLSDVSESSSDDDLIHKLSNDLELPLSMDEFDQFSGGIWSSGIGSSNNIKSPWSSESTSSFTSQETEYVKREPAGCDLIAEELTRQLYPNLISEAENCVTGTTTTVLKQEPNSPQHFLASPPPSDDGDDLWELLLNNTGDVKPNIKILDTPPVTPPQMSDGSPPHSPQPPDPSPPMTKTFILQPSQSKSNSINNSQGNQPIKVVTITTRNNSSGATKGGRISKTTKIQPKVITSSSQPQVISIVNSVNSAKVPLPKSASVSGVSNNTSTSRIVQLKAPVRLQQHQRTRTSPIITHSSSSSPAAATHGLTNAIISHTIGGQPTVLTASTQNGSASLAPLAPALQPGLKNDNLPDMKAFKRQQRMIKNRESASLSRKKKKEYVTTLEGQLSDMGKDNARLKEENNRLQQRISSLESELTSLRQSLGRGPSRKATTALFAVMLFAMLNMAPLTGVLLSSESRLNTMKTLVPGSKTSSAEVPKFHQRSLLWTEELGGSSVFENGSNSNSTSSMCPMFMNATESLRVKTQLQGWFERKTGKSNGNLAQTPTLPTASLPPPPPPPSHPKTKEGRKNIFSIEGKLNTVHQIQNEKIVQLKESGNALAATAAVPSSSGVFHGSGAAPATRMYSYLHPDTLHVDPSRSVAEDTSVVDVPRFGSFLDAIQRRDDTYYVVSFSSDQVLIPASSRNDSSRPRMSLLLPTAPLNGSMTPPPQHIAMMQIDCEVTHTKLVHISEDLVPTGMRNNKPTNVSHATPRHGSSSPIKRERKNYKSRSLFTPQKEQDPIK